MTKINLGKGIKGILAVDPEGKILDHVKLGRDTSPDYRYPILTAYSFQQLAMTETDPFDILKVVIDKGEVVNAKVMMGIYPIPKPTVNTSIEFTGTTIEHSPAQILNMWQEYLQPGPNNETE